MDNKQVIYVKVAGTTFDGRQEIIAEMVEGQKCILMKEPTNEFDPNAIAVYCCHPESKGWEKEKIGYIPKDRAVEIGAKMAPSVHVCEVDEVIGGFATSAGEKAYVSCGCTYHTTKSATYGSGRRGTVKTVVAGWVYRPRTDQPIAEMECAILSPVNAHYLKRTPFR